MLFRSDEVADRPSVVFAYTVKGYGLPIAGDPLNHAALLSSEQVNRLRDSLGLRPENEWDCFDPHSDEGRMCAAIGGEINNRDPEPRPHLPVPDAVNLTIAQRASTQETFGRILTRLGEIEGLADRMVTTSPDVSVSTNLGGWINKMEIGRAHV